LISVAANEVFVLGLLRASTVMPPALFIVMFKCRKGGYAFEWVELPNLIRV
jgi:hypothetical protein